MIYDRVKISDSIKAKAYDERNLTTCKCGKHHYPSKLMFIRFLEQFKDIKGRVDIWSQENWDTGQVKIYVEIQYKVPNLKEASK